jgi:hypothetical protein
MPTQADLNRLLVSIGKEVFVDYFDAFANSALSNADVAARLPSKYTPQSRASRTAHARRVMREGLASEALEIITESNRLDDRIVNRARVLLHRQQGRP